MEAANLTWTIIFCVLAALNVRKLNQIKLNTNLTQQDKNQFCFKMITQTWCWAYISKIITKFFTFPSPPHLLWGLVAPYPLTVPQLGWIWSGVPRVPGMAADLPRKLGNIHAKTFLKPSLGSKSLLPRFMVNQGMKGYQEHVPFALKEISWHETATRKSTQIWEII